MRFLTAFIITILLALVASGCEREDLTYEKEDNKKTEEKTDGKQDPKTGKDDPDDPNHPGDPNNPDTPPAPDPAAQALAAQVSGEWQGKLSTSYYDDYGVKQTGEYTTQMQFVLSAKDAVGGTGRETDYDAAGRQVWRMAFTWEVTDKQQICFTTTEGVVMRTKTYQIDASLFNATFESADGLETAVYEMKRKENGQ